MDRNFWLILVGVAVVLGGIFVFAGGKSDTSGGDFVGNPLEVQADDYVKGEGTEGVTLIEYADFSCPACGQVYPFIKQLESEYGDRIQFVFRHFPLTQIHPNATAAHRASIAAGNQGAFWEMHDQLYENQFRWTRQSSGLDVATAIDAFENYAELISLDMEQYRADAQSEETFDRINSDIDSGAQLGVTGTPTFFLNGERLPTPTSYEELKAAVDAEIAAVNATDSEETNTTEKN